MSDLGSGGRKSLLVWKRLKSGAYKAADDAGNFYLIVPRHSNKGELFEGWFRLAGHDSFGSVIHASKLKEVKATQQMLAEKPEFWAEHAAKRDPREKCREKTFRLDLSYLPGQSHYLNIKVNANLPEIGHLRSFLASEALEQKLEAYLTMLLEEALTKAEWGYDPQSYLDD